MITIYSKNYRQKTKIASDFKRQPGSLPGENDAGQLSVFSPKVKSKKNPKKKIYQLGIDVPLLESDLDSTQKPQLGML
jgi:hypothetical protein